MFILMVVVSVVLAAGLVALWREIGFDGSRIKEDGPPGHEASRAQYQARQASPAPAPVAAPALYQAPQATPTARQEDGQAPTVPSRSPAYPGNHAGASAATTDWPFGNLRQGDDFEIPSGDPYTGFLVLCSDDQDARRELASVASVAAQWGHPLLMAIARTFRGTGWTDRLGDLPGNIGQYDMRVEEVQALAPVGLPIVAFVSDGRVVNASAQLDSPTTIAAGFQQHRPGVAR